MEAGRNGTDNGTVRDYACRDRRTYRTVNNNYNDRHNHYYNDHNDYNYDNGDYYNHDDYSIHNKYRSFDYNNDRSGITARGW
jgi:hypothetical protein